MSDVLDRLSVPTLDLVLTAVAEFAGVSDTWRIPCADATLAAACLPGVSR